MLPVVALCGFTASVTVDDGVNKRLETVALPPIRIALDDDLDRLSLPNDLLGRTTTTTTTLTTYPPGPLVKVFFLPILVDTSIGAQVGSLVRGEETHPRRQRRTEVPLLKSASWAAPAVGPSLEPR